VRRLPERQSFACPGLSVRDTLAALREVPMTIPTGDLIVFDAECIFCTGFARFMDRHDTGMRFRFVRAQSATGRALYLAHDLDPEDWSTNIVIVDGRSYTKMAAFAAAMRAIGWPWRALAVLDLLPRRLADWLYDRIARNRYLFGRRDCPLPSAALRARILD
jgi:predicted DCC family thiol-disulfide oxidoreductase YuxK